VQIDEIFHALGDPTRRAIIERLAARPASVSDLAAPFGMSLPGIHQHLQILRNAGLVQTIKSGRVRTCRLEARTLHEAEGWLAKHRAMWERRFDALTEHLVRTTRHEQTRRAR
jgi:DNA-binding transcriptional ArsR family regulator